MNIFANPIKDCPRTEMTKLVCTNKQWWVKFEPTVENKIKLLDKIFTSNPHLKFSWETSEDYLYVFDYMPKGECDWDWAVMYAVDVLEMKNAFWLFSNAKYYNPYWRLSKEAYLQLAKDIEEEFKRGEL